MNMLSIGVLAVIAVILSLTIRPKNGEIALMLTLSCSVLILLSVFSRASEIIGTVNSIVAASQTNISYIVILLKVIGICLLTEFAVNTCRDAGSQSLAGNVSLAGKLLVTVTALPLYADILNTVMNLMG
ncbi:MAG: SpoIIIAC/SpoIIIAD family protein [Ruminococcus sp.]